ncbi:MAG TPA: HAMP domain-containing sensor histidine kinase [Polyangia bacterium]|nr:HAMP domain-containing sensor histidine kinase [Polyangia bacterium]
MATSVRLAGAVAVVLLGLVSRGHRPEWNVYLPMLGGYALIALVFFLLRRKPISPRLAWLSGLIDVGAIYIMQREVIPISNMPPVLATFSLGPFALMVTLSALTLQTRAIVVATVAAMVGQVLLMQEASMAAGAMFAGTVMIAFMGVVSHAILRQLRFLVLDVSEAEVKRHLEQRRRTETDAAKQTIERMLTEAQDQNQRLGTLQREKDSLVQLIVHDLRSPLNAVMLSLEYVAQEVRTRQAGSDLTEALDDARSTAHRVSGMVSQILDTAKLEEGRLALDRAPIGTSDLLKKVRQQLAPMARDKRVEVRVEAPPELAVRGDARLFGRVVENLLSNSIRHTPSGGKILLAAARVGTDCRLSVHNTGEPIHAEDRERIFAKFQQGSSEGPRLGGWGLGLYFCRMVVEAHGGHISVEDVEGWTASFVVQMPAEPAALVDEPAAHLS